MSDTEMEWLRAAIQGSDEAFTQVVEAYQKPVYNLCYRMLGDGIDAEDAAQESFWRAYQGLRSGRYDPQRPFITWLLSIAAHYCIDQQRRKRLPVVPVDLLPEDGIWDGAPSPERAVSQRLEDRRLRDLLAELPEQDRAAVILRYWYDFSDEEIGRALGLTVPAVKSRLFRARKALAERYRLNELATTHPETEQHGTPAF